MVIYMSCDWELHNAMISEGCVTYPFCDERIIDVDDKAYDMCCKEK